MSEPMIVELKSADGVSVRVPQGPIHYSDAVRACLAAAAHWAGCKAEGYAKDSTEGGRWDAIKAKISSIHNDVKKGNEA